MRGLGGGMQGLMKQANQMQSKMKKFKEEFATKTFTGSAGGGAAQVVVTGEYMIASMIIKPEVFESEAEMVTEMIQLAANDAIKMAKEEYQKAMNQLTKGISIPSMM